VNRLNLTVDSRDDRYLRHVSAHYMMGKHEYTVIRYSFGAARAASPTAVGNRTVPRSSLHSESQISDLKSAICDPEGFAYGFRSHGSR
jgi:hypothetical protein